MITFGCIVIGAALLTTIAAMAVAIVKAVPFPNQLCPLCGSDETHQEGEDDVACDFCGSRWKLQ